jgi:hypothetical protein
MARLLGFRQAGGIIIIVLRTHAQFGSLSGRVYSLVRRHQVAIVRSAYHRRVQRTLVCWSRSSSSRRVPLSLWCPLLLPRSAARAGDEPAQRRGRRRAPATHDTTSERAHTTRPIGWRREDSTAEILPSARGLARWPSAVRASPPSHPHAAVGGPDTGRREKGNEDNRQERRNKEQAHSRPRRTPPGLGVVIDQRSNGPAHGLLHGERASIGGRRQTQRVQAGRTPPLETPHR